MKKTENTRLILTVQCYFICVTAQGQGKLVTLSLKAILESMLLLAGACH